MHHVVPRSRGGTKTLPLCGVCHGRAHHNSGWVSTSALTKAGIEAARARGVKLGAPTIVESVDSYGRRYVDPAKATIVRAVQARYAAGGVSHRSLADALNAEGVPTTSGDGRWWPKTVRTALLTELPEG